MGGFANVTAGITNALAGKMQRILFSKVMASVSVALVPHSLWLATGMPGAGTNATVGPANGRALTSASAGALDMNNAASGENAHIVGGGISSNTANATGTLILCDRLCDVNLDVSANGAVTGAVAPSARMGSTTAPGDGGQLWMEVTTALSAAANGITISGNDGGGNGFASFTITTAASAIVGRSVSAALWQPIGVSMMRSISSVTLSVNNAATGVYNACVVRPLGHIPMLAVSQYIERDFMVELPVLPPLFNDACLFFIYVPTAAVTATIFGEFRTLSG